MEELPVDLFERDRKFNEIAKEFLNIDFAKGEFQYVLLSALLQLLLEKNIITEEELESACDQAGTAFKLMKHRKKLLDAAENPESGV
jgi:hypothetical protein